MAISLNTFQQTLDTSKVQGFIKLSQGGGVESYGGASSPDISASTASRLPRRTTMSGASSTRA